MTGHKTLIAMRRSGLKPPFVVVTDGVKCIEADYTVEVGDEETPEVMDLRFLVGCTVMVDGSDAQRVDRITKACVAAKAGRVVATTHKQTGPTRFETTRITDTEGVMNWQA